jgi:hypothetical protein
LGEGDEQFLLHQRTYREEIQINEGNDGADLSYSRATGAGRGHAGALAPEAGSSGDELYGGGEQYLLHRTGRAEESGGRNYGGADCSYGQPGGEIGSSGDEVAGDEERDALHGIGYAEESHQAGCGGATFSFSQQGEAGSSGDEERDALHGTGYAEELHEGDSDDDEDFSFDPADALPADLGSRGDEQHVAHRSGFEVHE